MSGKNKNFDFKKMADLGSKIIVTQIGSPIGRRYDQEQTLIGLGLNKLHKTKILENNSSVRGMIKKIRHLLKLEFQN